MTPPEQKETGHARRGVIAETAVVGAVGVVIAVEMNVRVLRIVCRPGSVRHETNAVPLRERPLREAIPVIGSVAREVEIVLETIVVHDKIGHAVSVVRNVMRSVAATNLDLRHPPASQLRQPYLPRAASTISVLEFLKSNLKPLRLRSASPARLLPVNPVRSPLRKVHEQRMQFCEAVMDL